MPQHVILVGEEPLTSALAARAEAASLSPLVHVLDGVPTASEVARWSTLLARAGEAVAALELVDTDLSLKHATLVALDQALPPDAPLLTSILGVAAGEVATWLRHPDRLVGMTLLPPLTDTSRVEVAVEPDQGAARDAAERVLRGLGLEVEHIQDSAGGVAPRIVACLVNEAAFALGEGVAGAEAIDEAMRLGVAYPRGPLEWGQAIGYTRIVAILDALHREMPDGRYRVAPWLRQQARRQRRVTG